MARPGKLLKQFEELKKKQSELFGQNQMVQAMQLQPKINKIKAELLAIQKTEEDRYYSEKKTLRELLPKDEIERNNIHKMLVKVSLASDYLYDCMFELKDRLNSMGILVDSLSEESNAVCKAANALASKLITDKAPKLSEVLLDDEPLIDGLHAVMDKYIEKSLKL